MILARMAPACVNPVGKPSSAEIWLPGGVLGRMGRLIGTAGSSGHPALPI